MREILLEVEEGPKKKEVEKYRRRATYLVKHSDNKVFVPWNVASRRRFKQMSRRRYRVKPGTPAPTPGYQPANSQCKGPFTAGGYAMGGHGIGSVYLSKPSLVAKTLRPTPMPTYKGQTYHPTHKPTNKPTPKKAKEEAK